MSDRSRAPGSARRHWPPPRPRARVDEAEDGLDAVLESELGALLHGHVRIRFVILGDQLDRAAKHSPGLVDLLDRQDGRLLLEQSQLTDAGQVEEPADLDGLLVLADRRQRRDQHGHHHRGGGLQKQASSPRTRLSLARMAGVRHIRTSLSALPVTRCRSAPGLPPAPRASRHHRGRWRNPEGPRCTDRCPGARDRWGR